MLIIILLSTFSIAAIRTNQIDNNNNNNHIQSGLLVQPINSSAVYENECHDPCSIDYCLKYLSLNKNCTKLIRNQCNCCTVCLRNENEICGGYLNVYGLCEQDLLCYKSNKTTNKLSEQTGICVQGIKTSIYIYVKIICFFFSVFKIPMFSN